MWVDPLSSGLCGAAVGKLLERGGGEPEPHVEPFYNKCWSLEPPKVRGRG